MAKKLVVYFSYSNGNTVCIAKIVADALQSDIARIVPVIPYNEDYDKVVTQGQKEVEEGYLPKLKPIGYDVKAYDTIVIGTPTWWYTMAPAVRSFIAENDWQGRHSVHDLRRLEGACHHGHDFPAQGCNGSVWHGDIL
jgi:flavodoxin